MKKLFLLFLLSVGALAQAPTNWYVRTDGGTRYSATLLTGQCDGKHDAAYPGSGVNQPCALNSPAWLFFDGNYTITPLPVIAGGDIVHIGPGQFRVGYLGPNDGDHDGLAVAGNPYGAGLPNIPSGTASHPTTFIGAGVGKTQIFSGYGSGPIFDVAGAGFVTIQDMELTDHGQCSRVGTGEHCKTDYPLDDYGQVGIGTNNTTHDIVLTNLNIHGFTSDGIRGPIGGLVTVNNVRIGFNGSAGWDFDDGAGTPVAAGSQVNASNLIVEGNGCNEEYPIVHPNFSAFTCFDQNNGGYGDGVGTPNTPLNFTCDHCTFRYNTQDGLDLLHTYGSIIKVTNSTSYGNMGQQWKLGPMKSVIFQNNTWVDNCSRMSAPIGGNSTFNKILTLFCRASGDGFAMSVNDGGTYVIQNNSYAGYGSTTYDFSCNGTCTKPNITFQNNLHIGYASPADGQLPAVFYWDTSQGMPANPLLANDHNIYLNMRTLPAGGVGTDPHIAGEPVWKDETSLDAVDFHLTAASTNALKQGTNGADIGAYGITPPVVTPPVVTPPVTTPPVVTPPVVVPIVVPLTSWQKVAAENQTVTLPPFTTYRYGGGALYKGPFTSGAAASTITANNATFGDPAVGLGKGLEVEQFVSSPPPQSYVVQCTVTGQTVTCK